MTISLIPVTVRAFSLAGSENSYFRARLAVLHALKGFTYGMENKRFSDAVLTYN
jgi:hypothetical protein